MHDSFVPTSIFPTPQPQFCEVIHMKVFIWKKISH